MDPTVSARAVSGVVAEMLAEAGISHRQAAERAGIPFTTMQRKMAGHSPLDIAQLAALANVLGSSVGDITLRAEREPEAAVS